MNKKIIFILGLIIVLALFVRVYKLGSVPPSLTWDEADVGYNAWTIANYGKDEWGEAFPLIFRSFGDDKQPVHIYSTALSVKLFGLSEFSTRLPMAIYGALNVLLVFLLVLVMFKNKTLAFLSSFLLAISPYNIHFSRFNHEANATLLFFLLGMLLFYLSFEKRKGFLVFSALSFGISIISYHSAKLVVPPMILALAVFYYKKLLSNKIYFVTASLIFAFFIILFLLEPRFMGLSRASQTSLGSEAIKQTSIYNKTGNMFLGKLEIISQNYLKNLSWEFLFTKGDPNPRLSSQVSGQFYKIDSLFLLLGLIYIFIKRSRSGFILVLWAILAPIPASITSESPHAARALFMMGSVNIISALGINFAISQIKLKKIRYSLLVFVLLIYFASFGQFIYNYFNNFARNYAIDYQYGMKQVVEYAKENPNYSHVFTTKLRGQPYIFYLYYLKYPLPDYLNNVVYNRGESSSFNMVDYFDKYYFDNWDPIESRPDANVLYILTSSEYDGLRYKNLFDVKRVIYNPNETIAFYLVSAN
ncbi:glycosyltransferase family 39 protein [Candidatus Daviesbacteria bacterium]|nr:glycosyltransferase family 39 protein [Candidatus Daviesbacteria bacterium]